MAVIDMSRAVAFAPRSAGLESSGSPTHGSDRVAAFGALTGRDRQQLAPIAAAPGTGLSAAGVVARTAASARTTDGSPPREAPV